MTSELDEVQLDDLENDLLLRAEWYHLSSTRWCLHGGSTRIGRRNRYRFQSKHSFLDVTFITDIVQNIKEIQW